MNCHFCKHTLLGKCIIPIKKHSEYSFHYTCLYCSTYNKNVILSYSLFNGDFIAKSVIHVSIKDDIDAPIVRWEFNFKQHKYNLIISNSESQTISFDDMPNIDISNIYDKTKRIILFS